MYIRHFINYEMVKRPITANANGPMGWLTYTNVQISSSNLVRSKRILLAHHIWSPHMMWRVLNKNKIDTLIPGKWLEDNDNVSAEIDEAVLHDCDAE